MKLVSLVIAFAVTMTLDAPLALAQVDQGRIAGTVRDQSNAFATATPVTVKNERTGEARGAVTNEKTAMCGGPTSCPASTHSSRAAAACS